MATNPNENGPYEVIYATNWSKGDKIELKSRLVVIRFKDINKPMRFAVRWQYQSSTGCNDNAPTHGGGSFSSKRTAQEAMWKNYLNHNDQFKKGNPSHLPGMAK